MLHLEWTEGNTTQHLYASVLGLLLILLVILCDLESGKAHWKLYLSELVPVWIGEISFEMLHKVGTGSSLVNMRLKIVSSFLVWILLCFLVLVIKPGEIVQF